MYADASGRAAPSRSPARPRANATLLVEDAGRCPDDGVVRGEPPRHLVLAQPPHQRGAGRRLLQRAVSRGRDPARRPSRLRGRRLHHQPAKVRGAAARHRLGDPSLECSACADCARLLLHRSGPKRGDRVPHRHPELVLPKARVVEHSAPAAKQERLARRQLLSLGYGAGEARVELPTSGESVFVVPREEGGRGAVVLEEG
eukprot:CAMPEP_0185502986 /NCGR_PEP_ID=MMETSP1366-20130426/30348_1 /TAXON_ID=38817 /ORGANISM="Gephyrocapsa oceanica, Strain RCC1303" /LENGTH=200 /DNA_ID=CAMNT_0028112723 /DNA_START=59 /DNA_END=661 /DNA_ORIENTATION=+